MRISHQSRSNVYSGIPTVTNVTNAPGVYLKNREIDLVVTLVTVGMA
jgi:hypothetical protein